jgi:hypothetical protein
MRAMRTGMKTIFASVLALGVCVWVGEARADGSDELSMGGSVGSEDLAHLNGGGLTIATATSTVTGTSENNEIYNQDGKITTGAGENINIGSHGIVMQANNSGINSLIQQNATINVIFAPAN